MENEEHNPSNTPNLPQPIVTKRKKLSMIWLVPFIALLIGLWLGYKAYMEREIPVRVSFMDGSALVEEKTLVKYEGVPIGHVTKVHLKKNLKKVIVELKIERFAEAIAVEGTQFWIEKPRIGLSGISGLGTIFSGSYITIRPGEGEAKV